jgi:hypothetical protein
MMSPQNEQDTYQYVCDLLSQGVRPSLIEGGMYQTYIKVMTEKQKQKHANAERLHELKMDIIKSGVRGDSCATQVKLPVTKPTTCDLPEAWLIDKQPEEPQKLYPAIVCRPPANPKPTPAPKVNYQEDRKRFAGITLATPAFLLFFVTIGNIISMSATKVEFSGITSTLVCVFTHLIWLFVSLFLFGRYLIITKEDSGTNSRGPR